MEDSYNIQDKLARLINKFQELKDNYQQATSERDKWRNDYEQLQSSQEGNASRIAELEENQRQAKSELEFLRSENHKLRQKLQGYEEKMQAASAKIDNIFEQIDSL